MALVAWWRVCHTVATRAQGWCGMCPGVRCGMLWAEVKGLIMTPRWSTAPALHASTAPLVNWGSSAATWVTSRQTCSQSVSTKLKNDSSYWLMYQNLILGTFWEVWKSMETPMPYSWLLYQECVTENFVTFYIPSTMVWLTLPSAVGVCVSVKTL